MQKLIKTIINSALTSLGYHIQRIHPDNPNPIRPWDDEDFRVLMKEIEGNTLVDRSRCYMLHQFAIHTSGICGDAAEVGVYKGGTARLLSMTLKNIGKVIHLFDTFSGMPVADPDRDIHRQGDFSDISIDKVKAYLKDCRNVRFHQGIFPETAGNLEDETFCLVHVDADIYRSVLDCCRFFYPRMQAGGIMVFDDYGFLTCPGAKDAVDEFFKQKPENPCYLPTGQCIVVKLQEPDCKERLAAKKTAPYEGA